MPITPMNNSGNMVPIPVPAPAVDPTAMSGALYMVMLFFFVTIIVVLIVVWVIIKIWGNPIMVAGASRTGGRAIIQHFENSKIGRLMLASIGGGALRHTKVEDGTLITIPKGINNLEGHSFVNSWGLTGISIPTFLMGAITKIRQLGIHSRQQLEKEDEATKNLNLITDAYNFNDIPDIIKKSKDPSIIPLEIEYVPDFIEATNQHYTESIIMKSKWSYTMGKSNMFTKVMMTTGIVILIISIAGYFVLTSLVK